MATKNWKKHGGPIGTGGLSSALGKKLTREKRKLCRNSGHKYNVFPLPWYPFTKYKECEKCGRTYYLQPGSTHWNLVDLGF